MKKKEREKDRETQRQTDRHTDIDVVREKQDRWSCREKPKIAIC